MHVCSIGFVQVFTLLSQGPPHAEGMSQSMHTGHDAYMCQCCGFQSTTIDLVQRHQDCAPSHLNWSRWRPGSGWFQVKHYTHLCKHADIVQVRTRDHGLHAAGRAVEMPVANPDQEREDAAGRDDDNSDASSVFRLSVDSSQDEFPPSRASDDGESGESTFRLSPPVPMPAVDACEILAALMNTTFAQCLQNAYNHVQPWRPAQSPGNHGLHGQPARDDMRVSPARSVSPHLVDLSWTEANVYKFIAESGLAQKHANMLLRMLKDIRFNPLDMQYTAIDSYHRRIAAQQDGILHLDLTRPAADGDNELVLWYRDPWLITKAALQDSEKLAHMTLHCEPEFDASGNRLFGSFRGSWWLQIHQEQVGPDVTIVGILLGADGFDNGGLSGHPGYMHLLNCTEDVRGSPDYWWLVAMIPLVQKECLVGTWASDFGLQRRKRQVTDASFCALFSEILRVRRQGGELVTCADGITRRIMPVLVHLNMDRLDHERTLWMQQHLCPLCKTPKDRFGSWQAAPSEAGFRTAREVLQECDTAMRTGQYGDRRAGGDRPILQFDEATQDWRVLSEKQYLRCCRTIGFAPEVNKVMKMLQEGGVDVLKCCFPDPLHTTANGVMKHLIRAVIATFAAALTPQWARGTAECGTVASITKICNRLDERLKTVAPRAPKRARSVFAKGMRSYVRGRKQMFEFTVTGKEAEIVYEHFIFCLPGAIDEELEDLNQLAREQGHDPVPNPTAAMVDALSKFMAWHRASTSVTMNSQQLALLHKCTGQVIASIAKNIPTRSLRIQVEANSQANSQRTHEAAWGLPKVHALWHATEAIFLLGSWQLCSMQAVEHWHCFVKKFIKLTNQRGMWALQIFKRVVQKEAARVEACRLNEEQAHPLGRSATRQQNPAWAVIRDWRQCEKTLVTPMQGGAGGKTNAGIVIPWTALYVDRHGGARAGQWVRNCRDMENLPNVLAKFIVLMHRHRFPQQFRKLASDRASVLGKDLKDVLNGALDVYNSHGNSAASRERAHLLLCTTLRIQKHGTGGCTVCEI